MAYKNPEDEKAYRKVRYQWNKEHGICVQCAANWAEPGHVTCKPCRIKAAHSRLKYDTSLGEKKRSHNRREEYISKGLCKDCGKPTIGGLKVCKKCRDRRRESALIYRIRQKILREAVT